MDRCENNWGSSLFSWLSSSVEVSLKWQTSTVGFQQKSWEKIKICMQKNPSTGHPVRRNLQCPYCFTYSFSITCTCHIITCTVQKNTPSHKQVANTLHLFFTNMKCYTGCHIAKENTINSTEIISCFLRNSKPHTVCIFFLKIGRIIYKMVLLMKS